MDMLQSIMDASSHAMLTLDRNGIVTHINQQAKEYFGLYNRSERSHGPGRLEPGDLVVIADTALGADDGNLTCADLERLGVHEKKLRPGDQLAAVGVYCGAGKPVYKFLHGGDTETLELDTVYQEIGRAHV